MLIVRIGKRGQITFPREIRRQYGLSEGDSLAVIPLENQVILRPLTKTLLDVRASIPVEAPQDFGKIRKQVIAARTRRMRDG
jgi:AbrB family looped-hinge helix DNA binding protein